MRVHPGLTSSAALFLAILTAACSGGGKGAPTPTPTPVLTNDVHVVDALGLTVANAAVMVSDSSGGVTALVFTSANGVAHVSVPTRGMVTTFDPPVSGTTFRLHSFVAPPTGLALSATHQAAVPMLQRTAFEISVTSPPVGATAFLVNRACPGESLSSDYFTSSPQVEFDNECTRAAAPSFYVTALSATGATLAWGSALHVARAPGTAVPVSVTPNLQSFDPFTATVSGSANLQQLLILLRGADDAATSPFTGTANIQPILPLTQTIRFPHIGADVRVVVQAQPRNSSVVVDRSETWSTATAPSTTTVATDTLYDLSAARVLLDPIHPEVTWAAVSGTPAPQVARVILSAQTGSYAFVWDVVAPAAAKGVRYPNIPDELLVYRPSTSWDLTANPAQIDVTGDSTLTTGEMMLAPTGPTVSVPGEITQRARQQF